MAVAKILVILGATGSGKSELAMALARECGGEILSVDSMQVYRGMDIGTAKPTAKERAEARHHLIDVVEPNETFTAARYVEMADGVIADAAGRKVPMIATGGTPLYFKSLFEGLFEGPGADEKLRDRLREISGEELHRRLVEIDREAAERIHPNDTRRLIRAIEVYELTGKPISTMQNEWEQEKWRHEAIWVGLAWDREALNRRINARVKEMMTAGWLEETRSLVEKHGELSKTAAEATGYAELLEHLRGKISLEEAVEQIKIGTRQLARRQMKWFKRFGQTHWIGGEEPLEEKVRQARRLWQ